MTAATPVSGVSTPRVMVLVATSTPGPAFNEPLLEPEPPLEPEPAPPVDVEQALPARANASAAATATALTIFWDMGGFLLSRGLRLQRDVSRRRPRFFPDHACRRRPRPMTPRGSSKRNVTSNTP